MTEQDQNQLLDAIFDDEALSQMRQATLVCGVKEMRRRRHRALAARVSLLALPALLLLAVAFYPSLQPHSQVPGRTRMALASKAGPKVEYITADQLFALFPNRAMALVGKPGHQQLIFLDAHSTSESQ